MARSALASLFTPQLPLAAVVAAGAMAVTAKAATLSVDPTSSLVTAANPVAGVAGHYRLTRAGLQVGITPDLLPQPGGKPGNVVLDINHLAGPAGYCWTGVTPEFRQNDSLSLTQGATVTTMAVGAVTITAPVASGQNDVVVTGFAHFAGGGVPAGANLTVHIRVGTGNSKQDFNAGTVVVDPGTGAYTGTFTPPSGFQSLLLTGVADTALLDPADGGTTMATVGETTGPKSPCTVAAQPLAQGPQGLSLTPDTDTGVSSADGITSNTTPTIQGVTTTPGATASITLTGPGGPPVLTSGPSDATTGYFTIPVTPALANGLYSVTATETDGVTTTPSNAPAMALTVDTTAPNPPPALGTDPKTSAAGPSSNSTPLVLGAVEPGATVQLFANGTCVGPAAATGPGSSFGGPGIPLTVGLNTATTISARVTDVAGNQAPCSTTVTYHHDSIPPVAPSGLATTPVSPSTQPTISVHGLAPGASSVTVYPTADCTGNPYPVVDAATFSGPGLSVVNLPLTPGTYTFSATAADAAKNVSGCSASITFVRPDVTAPVVTITSGPSGAATGNTVAFSFTADEPATFECALTSGGAPAFASCAPGIGYGPLAEGSYTFSVRGRDTAGNIGAAVTRGFTVPNPPSSGTTNPPVVSTTTTPTGTTIQYIVVNGQVVPAATVNGKIVQLLGAPSMITRKVRMARNGNVVLLVRCTGPAGGACSGSVDVVRRIPANTSTGAKARTVRLARRQMVALTGQTVQVTLRLSVAGQAAVKKDGALGLSTVVTPAGAKGTTFPLTVRKPMV